MTIKYEFLKLTEGEYTVQSNLVCNELDLLEVVLSDVSLSTYNEFINHLKTRRQWWSNASRVEFKGDTAIIYPAFPWDDDEEETKAELKILVLKKICQEWRQYLHKKTGKSY